MSTSATTRALLHIPELTDEILKHLPLPSALSARLVCTTWRDIIDSRMERVWHQSPHYPPIPGRLDGNINEIKHLLANHNTPQYREVRGQLGYPTALEEVLYLEHSIIDRILNTLPLRTVLPLFSVSESWKLVIETRLTAAWDAGKEDEWDGFGEGLLEPSMLAVGIFAFY